ncbi:MAG: EthD family reductase [Acidobacteriota bacterium]
MVRVTAFYAHSDDAQFDWDYYVNKHLPMVRELLGGHLLAMEVDRGLYGVAAGLPPMYIAMVRLDFESQEILQGLMINAVPKIVADIPNYTSVALQIQVSELVK